jgi:hypothetical protein
MAAVQETTFAVTTETTIIPAAAGINNALVGLVITTLNAVVGTLTFKDKTGGTDTTRYIVIDYPVTAAVPLYPFIFFLPVGRELYQSAPGQNWTVTASANATGYKINAFYLEM